MMKEKTTKTSTLKTQKSSSTLGEIVLFDDDVNTLDFVINTLIEDCNHNPEQAEQCTMLIHYNGEGVVKSGNISELRPIASSMYSKGLTVKIQ